MSIQTHSLRHRFAILAVGIGIMALTASPAFAQHRVSLTELQDEINAANQAIARLQREVTHQLREHVNLLEHQNDELQSAVSSLQSQVTQLVQQNQALTTTLACVSTSTTTDFYFSGCNVHILSGAGATDAAANGLGNLIVGYNELRNDGNDARTGSHNLVVGKNNNYASYGGFVAGYHNSVTGPFASVSGGSSNTAVSFASVSGGVFNMASGLGASVSGGYGNTASGQDSSVGGGDSLSEINDQGWAAGSYHTP